MGKIAFIILCALLGVTLLFIGIFLCIKANGTYRFKDMQTEKIMDIVIVCNNGKEYGLVTDEIEKIFDYLKNIPAYYKEKSVVQQYHNHTLSLKLIAKDKTFTTISWQDEYFFINNVCYRSHKKQLNYLNTYCSEIVEEYLNTIPKNPLASLNANNIESLSVIPNNGYDTPITLEPSLVASVIVLINEITTYEREDSRYNLYGGSMASFLIKLKNGNEISFSVLGNHIWLNEKRFSAERSECEAIEKFYTQYFDLNDCG